MACGCWLGRRWLRRSRGEGGDDLEMLYALPFGWTYPARPCELRSVG